MGALTKLFLIFACFIVLVHIAVSMPHRNHEPHSNSHPGNGGRGNGLGPRHRPGNGHGRKNHPHHPQDGSGSGSTPRPAEEHRDEDDMDEYIIVTKKKQMSTSQQHSMANSCEMFLDTVMHMDMRKRRADRALPQVKKFSKFNIGFSAMMNRKAAEMVNALEDVEFVERNQNVTVASTFTPGYHLDRIDQADLPLNGEYQPKYTGKDVDIYILDTGIRYTHEVFGGRASFGGYDDFGGNGEDCQGHGTHVAALAGGDTTGAAVRTNLYSIRVLDCNSWGTYVGVISGINHVINRAKDSGRRTILSMSIQGKKSSALNVALKEAEEAGIINVLAAGNDKSNACLYSPASSTNGITVGGSNRDDGLFWFTPGKGTNHGECVDVFAPGQNVNSASHLSDTGIVSMSGTSMATPLVSGVVAMLLEEDPSLTPEQVKEEVIKRATKDVLDFSLLPADSQKSTPNLLVLAEAKIGEGPTPTSTSVPVPAPSSTTVSSVTLDTTTTTETVALTTENLPTSTPTPTPDPIPTPEPLPSEPNLISPEVSIADVASDVDSKQSLGFVPSSVNSFVIQGNLYLSISYKFVGIDSAATMYIVHTDVPLKDLDHVLSVSKVNGNWVPVAMAPYMKDEKTAAIFVVLKQNAGNFVLATSETVEEFQQDMEVLKASNYYPVSLRYLTNEFEQTSVFVLYRKWANTEIVSDMKVSEFITHAYSLKGEKKFLQDITFRTTKDGNVVYSGVFQKDTTNAETMYIDFRDNFQTTVTVFNVLRNAQFHAVTLSPVLSPQPGGFLVVYWR